jgi:hypothetical protein
MKGFSLVWRKIQLNGMNKGMGVGRSSQQLKKYANLTLMPIWNYKMD